MLNVAPTLDNGAMVNVVPIGSVIRPGEAQRMSAGSGVQHSEFNPPPTDEIRFLRIWIEPEQSGPGPRCEQPAFPLEDNRSGWTLLDVGARFEHQVESGRHAWNQVISGETEVYGRRLQAGDGGASDGAGEMIITRIAEESHVLLFDLS